MRLTCYFWPQKLENGGAPQGGHALMEVLGMIHRVEEGLYAWSPLGLKSLKAVSAVVRNEKERAGGLECMMTLVQPQHLWAESGRLKTFGEGLVTFSDHQGGGLLCGPTGEEIVTDFFRRHVHTEDVLPKMFFQLQWKFHDQASSSRGMFNSREFITADGYSFDIDALSSRVHYEKILRAYAVAFEQLGLDVIVMPGHGGLRSHELVAIGTSAGDDYVFDDAARLKSGNVSSCLMARAGVASETISLPNRARGIPVGCLDELGTRYSDALDAKVQSESGTKVVFMGAYRVNLSALTAVMMDVHSDDRGMVWPKSATPFVWALVAENTPEARQRADVLYDQCRARELDVLYDDRDVPEYQERAEMDLLGLPYQVWVGRDDIRVIERASGNAAVVSEAMLVANSQRFDDLFAA